MSNNDRKTDPGVAVIKTVADVIFAPLEAFKPRPPPSPEERTARALEEIAKKMK